MAERGGVTVAELVDLSRSREGRLPFEIGAFVALETSEHLLREGPAIVSPDDVRIGDDGAVAVRAAPHSASGVEAARSVVDVLAHLLVASGTGVPPVLLSLVEEGPAQGRWDLVRLRDELEASLVPLNRSAARRVLSRLLRDAGRPARSRTVRPPAAEMDIDADLDALLDGKPTNTEPPTQKLQALDASGNPIVDFADVIARKRPREELFSRPPPALDLDEPGHVPQRGARATPRPAPESEPPAPPRSVDSVRPTDPAPGETHGRSPDLDGFEESPAPKGRGMWIALLMLVVLAGSAVGLYIVRPDIVARIFGEGAPTAPPGEDEDPPPPPPPVARASGDLVVTGPEGSQIFLFVGRGPAVAENLPLGVAHEMVAVADGREPTRAVVPADAQWSTTDDGPLYELAMQTGEAPMAFERLDLGETRLTRDGMGAPSGSLGRIRVLTTPPGARVFLLIGFERASVQDLPVDEPLELLVYAPEMRPERVFVGPSDWVDEGGERTATVDVQLQSR